MSLDVYLCVGEDRFASCSRCTTLLDPDCWQCQGKAIVNAGKRAVYDANITHNLTTMADAAGIEEGRRMERLARAQWAAPV